MKAGLRFGSVDTIDEAGRRLDGRRRAARRRRSVVRRQRRASRQQRPQMRRFGGGREKGRIEAFRWAEEEALLYFRTVPVGDEGIQTNKRLLCKVSQQGR